MNKQKIALLYPFVFFVTTSMFVRSWIPFFHSSWYTLMFGCILSIYLVPDFMRTKWLTLIVIYSLVILLNWYVGDTFYDQFNFVANEIAMFFLFCSAIYYMLTYNDKKCIDNTYWAMFVMLGIAAVGSIYVNRQFPGIIRMQDVIFLENGVVDTSVIEAYQRMGLSNYLLPHGLPVLIPPLALLIKRSKLWKLTRITAIFFLIFIYILVVLGGSTTVLLLSLFASFVFLFDDKKNSFNRYPIIITLFLLPFLLFPEIITSIIELFTGDTLETYAMHLDDMANYSSRGAEGNTMTRMSLYMKSIAEFLENPIWGTNGQMGTHSVLLDRLGTLGGVGFIPFIGIIYSYMRFIWNKMGRIEYSYFKISVLVGVIMLLIKGIDDAEVWLMFFVVSPVILYKSRYLELS